MSNINEKLSNSQKRFDTNEDFLRTMSSDINNINKHFDTKFSEMKEQQNVMSNEMKQQNVNLVKQFDKHLNDISESQKQMIKRCDNIIEKMKDWTEKWNRDSGLSLIHI